MGRFFLRAAVVVLLLAAGHSGYTQQQAPASPKAIRARKPDRAQYEENRAVTQAKADLRETRSHPGRMVTRR